MELRQRKPEDKRQTSKQQSGDAAASSSAPSVAAPPPKSKLQTLLIRSVVGIIMIIFFLLILWSDHAVVCLFVVSLQVFAFREFINLRYRQEKEKKLAAFRSLHWYGSKNPFTRVSAAATFRSPLQQYAIKISAINEVNMCIHRYFLFVTFFWVYGKAVLTWSTRWFPAERWPVVYELLIHRHNWHSFVLYTIGMILLW
jgi:hypothetical protein